VSTSPPGRREYVHQDVPKGFLELYTDGSVDPNPGTGGCAVVDGRKVVWTGYEPAPTTNNRMEGMAILAALRYADGRPCVIHTDSQYWESICNSWAAKWEKLGWVRRKGQPITSLDLVQAIHTQLLINNRARVRWIRGHGGHRGNELADEAANVARLRALRVAQGSRGV
jgi:ribonuclease HI